MEVVKRLGRAGEGRLVWLRLKQRKLPNGYVEVVATDVEVGGFRDG